MDPIYDGFNSLNAIRKELRKDTFSVKNRLQSIVMDSKFVERVAGQTDWPIVPNERCGLWYVPPQRRSDTSYFKSTDGHTGQWQFSMRRLNLHLVPLIKQKSGIIIVDSTRKGKTMPDALSKTIPIWCAVLNCIAFEDSALDDLTMDKNEIEFLTSIKANNWVYLPNLAESEKSQIASLIPQMVKEVKRLKLMSKQSLALSKPLIPQWVFPGKSLIRHQPNFYCVVCLTASEKTAAGDNRKVISETVGSQTVTTSWQYIQGSADDHELWATSEICQGRLDASSWWEMYQAPELIDSTGYIHQWLSDEALINLLNAQWINLTTAKETQNSGPKFDVSTIGNTGITFGKISQNVCFSEIVKQYANVKTLITFSCQSKIVDIPPDFHNEFHYDIESNKKGSKSLRAILPKLFPKLELPIIIMCDTGTDLSVAMVLILLCKRFNLKFEPEPVHINKDLVKQFLSEITGVRKVNPSRNTLQTVNSFLM